LAQVRKPHEDLADHVNVFSEYRFSVNQETQMTLVDPEQVQQLAGRGQAAYRGPGSAWSTEGWDSFTGPGYSVLVALELAAWQQAATEHDRGDQAG
tara:strand:- start:107 stop:394 length:288 start_codon:yes stop_codon:yes gene_type:complete